MKCLKKAGPQENDFSKTQPEGRREKNLQTRQKGDTRKACIRANLADRDIPLLAGASINLFLDGFRCLQRIGILPLEKQIARPLPCNAKLPAAGKTRGYPRIYREEKP